MYGGWAGSTGLGPAMCIGTLTLLTQPLRGPQGPGPDQQVLARTLACPPLPPCTQTHSTCICVSMWMGLSEYLWWSVMEEAEFVQRDLEAVQ